MYVKCVSEKAQHLFEVDAIEVDQSAHSKPVSHDAYYALSEKASKQLNEPGASVPVLYVSMRQADDEVLLVTDADVYVMNSQGETIDRFRLKARL